MTIADAVRRRLRPTLAGLLLLGGCAAAPPPPVAPNPPPPGAARVWFLRQWETGESWITPMIYLNGTAMRASVPGTIFYRDFAPGTYTFSVATCGMDTNQSATLRLASGDQVDLEIQSLSSWTPPDCGYEGTFYVRRIPPKWAKLYLPQLKYLGPG